MCQFLQILTKAMLSNGVVASSPTPRLYCTNERPHVEAERVTAENGGTDFKLNCYYYDL